VKLLDRYIFRSFFVPFVYCFLGFLAIWLVFDLTDNGPDFLEARASPRLVAYFYLTQLPNFILICLPVGLLLALLYSLSRLSRSNEIISMLTAGRSVSRILLPLFIAGLLATGVSLALNYELAPRSEATKKSLLERMTRGKEKNDVVEQLFRNRADHRTWYVQRLRADRDELQGVHITQQDEKGEVIQRIYARRARFDRTRNLWVLENGKIVNFLPDGEIRDEQVWRQREFPDWSETPFRILSANLEPQNLTMPELARYLRLNSDFPEAQLAPYATYLQHRWALPWSCLVVVFIGAPLGIVYSRRGVLAGVASSIFIFFGMLFLTELFLSLGKGARVPAPVAGWAPNVIFALIGFFLLYLRAGNRELSSLFTRRARRVQAAHGS
jgi:lipopolysaccharide export system permease protein